MKERGRTRRYPEQQEPTKPLPSEDQLRQEALFRAVSHPATSLPLFAGFLLTAYSLALAPFLGGFAIALPAGIASGAIGLFNGAKRFLVSQKELDQKMADMAEERLREQRETELQKEEDAIRSLQANFQRMIRARGPFSQAAQRGQKEIKDLMDAKGLVEREVERGRQGKLILDVSRVEQLTRKVFREGLTLLSNVVDIADAAVSEDETTLVQEIDATQKDLQELEGRNGGRGQEIVATKRNALASKQARLKKISGDRDLVELLLCRADECESTLRTAQINLARMRMEGSEDSLAETLQKLQDCLSLALEVRKQLKAERGINV